ncbi:MAG: inverse autotransporter beta domain-containing protein [Veillonella sp.]|uniref:inverse autotransporter beta domain-containing protein n=1 Tax=Veillonella sp. TaxID=1926307 RepID=UPI00257C530A|nr:inverse autotransporter beta domain-containing protein [Veillonella sp.]MBS5756713.1 inverse autotransporter beta domain-containing protein [Veillonella sp.]
MKRKLVLTSMILGVIVCSMSAVVRATDVAQQVSDTARHDAVQSNWMDRTDIAVGVQTGGQSKLDKGHFLTDDQNSIYNKQSDYGNLTKAYIETLHPISHYDENSKSVLFVQGRIGRGGEKIASKEMRGYFINEPIILRNGQLSSYTKKNTDEKSSETLGIIGAVGIGYRRLSRNEHAYVGVNAFVDRAFTGNYNRISGGVEYVNGLNEVYANVYRGLGDKDLVKGGGGNPYPKRLYPNGYPSDFPYHTIPSENYYTYKGGRALGGYEIGFARSFKNARWAHAYVNGYRWKGQGFGHEQNYNWGRPGHWSVPWFSVRDANHYKGIKIGAELQLTWGGKHSDDTITTARSKMLDKVRRQDMIVESFDDIEYDYLAPIDHL